MVSRWQKYFFSRVLRGKICIVIVPYCVIIKTDTGFGNKLLHQSEMTEGGSTPLYISREISIEHPSVGLASLAHVGGKWVVLVASLTC